MEAVRLGFPLDVTQLLHEFASDRVGVHPTASLWANEVERWDMSDSLVEWVLVDAEGDFIITGTIGQRVMMKKKMTTWKG